MLARRSILQPAAALAVGSVPAAEFPSRMFRRREDLI